WRLRGPEQRVENNAVIAIDWTRGERTNRLIGRLRNVFGCQSVLSDRVGVGVVRRGTRKSFEQLLVVHVDFNAGRIVGGKRNQNRTGRAADRGSGVIESC